MPVVEDLAQLYRLVRYLVSSARVLYTYPWQRASGIVVYTDTDFAGCPATRKSTSGGIACRGQHVIKTWITTQKVITLSSGEAELAGVVKGVAEGMGIQALAEDLQLPADLKVYADSSAAIGICKARGWVR